MFVFAFVTVGLPLLFSGACQQVSFDALNDTILHMDLSILTTPPLSFVMN